MVISHWNMERHKERGLRNTCMQELSNERYKEVTKGKVSIGKNDL